MDNDQNSVDQKLYHIGRSWSEAHYNPEARLVGNSVRGGAAYALMLVAGGDSADCREAELIVQAVLAEQKTNTGSPDFGLFKTSAGAEAYTDQNWAAFCGSYLMHIPRAYAAGVDDGCLKAIEEALLRACAYIQKRDVRPGYTNIALLSASVLTVAGEMYGAGEYLEEGRRKIRELVDHIDLRGGFEEYSSPTYYGTNLSALCWMGMFVQDEEIQDLALKVQARLWHTIAMHYHAPTGQLAGPHSRAYGNILQNYAAALKYYLYKVLGEDFDLGENAEHGGDTTYAALAALQEVACPEDAVDVMLKGDYPRFVEETVQTDGRRVNAGYVGPFTQMTTYMTGAYALGTINRGEAWYQRRNLLLYWQDSKRQPAALTTQVQENDKTVRGQDSLAWSVQKEGRALVIHDLSELREKALTSYSIVMPMEVREIPDIWVGERPVEELPKTLGDRSTLYFRSGAVAVGIRFFLQGFLNTHARGIIRPVAEGLEVAVDLYRGDEEPFSGEKLGHRVCVYGLEVAEEVDSGRDMADFIEQFEDAEFQIDAGEEGLTVQWRLQDAVLTIEPTGEPSRKYEGVLGGLAVTPERLVEENLRSVE